jgi:hypothetical protein
VTPARESVSPAAVLKSEEAIRREYELKRLELGNAGGKILAQTATDSGTDIAVSGRVDPDLGKTLTLHSAAHSIGRMVPLDEAGATVMAEHFQAHGHHGSREAARRMLEHLLLEVSDFYVETPVTEFRLGIRLHENSYTVLGATMTSSAKLHVKERLGRHAHDRRTGEYHPSGRQ